MIIAAIDVFVLWCICSGSKRKDDPVYFEESGILQEYASRNY
jgi:hypothetical protein